MPFEQAYEAGIEPKQTIFINKATITLLGTTAYANTLKVCFFFCMKIMFSIQVFYRVPLLQMRFDIEITSMRERARGQASQDITMVMVHNTADLKEWVESFAGLNLRINGEVRTACC